MWRENSLYNKRIINKDNSRKELYERDYKDINICLKYSVLQLSRESVNKFYRFCFHLGRGIPFYILINKNGVIVDFEEHLRPSISETRKIIEKYL